MKKILVRCNITFLILNFLICLLFNDFSYDRILDSFSFFNHNNDFSFILMTFSVIYIILNIFLINKLIEEKKQVYKYIYVRSNSNAIKIYFVRMLKEISLIILSKIICDFIFWILFDRNSFIVFLKISFIIYLTVLLWFIIFDCLSTFSSYNNIITFMIIFILVLSNMLINYSGLFTLLTINTYNNTIVYFRIILYKLFVLLFILFCDIRIRIKKEYY